MHQSQTLNPFSSPCRLSHLPNIENHRFDPNISPYDVPKIEDFKKPPEVYKKANIYRMDNSASGSQSRHQRVKLERNEQRKVRPQRRNFQLPNRELPSPQSSGFLSNLLNPFNPFRKVQNIWLKMIKVFWF